MLEGGSVRDATTGGEQPKFAVFASEIGRWSVTTILAWFGQNSHRDGGPGEKRPLKMGPLEGRKGCSPNWVARAPLTQVERTGGGGTKKEENKRRVLRKKQKGGVEESKKRSGREQTMEWKREQEWERRQAWRENREEQKEVEKQTRENSVEKRERGEEEEVRETGGE